MDYLWLKAFHLAAVLTWVGGVLVMAIAITVQTHLPQTLPTAQKQAFLTTARKWDMRVTNPALGLVWILGITLAVMGNWLTSPWFLIKLVIVTGLSAIHGMQSGALRRLSNNPDHKIPAVLKISGPITVISIICVAILVIVKPF